MGKNHFSFLLVLFGFMFISQNTLAACNLSIKLLQYAGTRFPETYDKGCVDWDTVKLAQIACTPKAIHGQAINFDNTEFNIAPNSPAGSYYICASTKVETIKINICENLASENSRFNKQANGAKITFSFKQNKCMCSVAGIEGERDCSKVFPFTKEVADLKEKADEDAKKRARNQAEAESRKICEDYNAHLANDMVATGDGTVDCICKKTAKMIKIGGGGPRPTCAEPPAKPSQASATPPASGDSTDNRTCDFFGLLNPPAGADAQMALGCLCKGVTIEHSVSKNESGIESCKTIARVQDEERQRVAAAAAAPTEPTQDLKTCVDDGLKEAQSCKDVQDSAGKTCDENNLDKDAEKITNAAAGAYISTKSGTGAQQECFTAGLVSNAGLTAVKMVKDECEILVTSCKNKCSTQVFEKFEKECKPKVAGIAVNEQYYNSKSGAIKQTLSESLSTCEGKIEKDKSVIGNLFEQVGDALGKSLSCMCKLSSGATASTKEGCNIPSVQTCETSPSLPGCSAYVGIGPCTPGSGYDAKLCSCQINAKGAGCPGGGLSGNLVGFASGANINDAGSSGADIGVPVSNLTGSGIDLSGSNNNSGPAANLKLEPTKVGTANSGGPGGGTGGSGSSGGGEAPSGGSGEEEEKSSLGGLFNQAKSFVSNLTGGDRYKQNGAIGKPKNATKPDIDKFRPRGMASNDSIVGSKNMDIWKMMNLCTNGENCKSNVNNYILGP